MNKDERVLQFFTGGIGNLVGSKERVPGKETAPADSIFGISRRCRCAFDEFDAGPKTARVLPASTGAADPFTEDGAGRNDATLGFLHRSVERRDLAGGAHTGADQGSEEVRRNREPRSFGNPVHIADEFESASRTENLLENFGKRSPRAFDAGRYKPRD